MLLEINNVHIQPQLMIQMILLYQLILDNKKNVNIVKLYCLKMKNKMNVVETNILSQMIFLNSQAI